MAARIAFFTFGVLKEPAGHEAVQGFIDRIAGVYDHMDGSEGFFARSQRNVETWEHSWGPMVIPGCAPEGMGLDRIAMTLSTWRDVKSVAVTPTVLIPAVLVSTGCSVHTNEARRWRIV